jgi:penicillin-binding protein-related factor A (putative recombinase)
MYIYSQNQNVILEEVVAVRAYYREDRYVVTFQDGTTVDVSRWDYSRLVDGLIAMSTGTMGSEADALGVYCGYWVKVM